MRCVFQPLHSKPLILLTHNTINHFGPLISIHVCRNIQDCLGHVSCQLDHHMGFYFKRISSSPPCALFYVASKSVFVCMMTICIQSFTLVKRSVGMGMPLAMSLSPNSHLRINNSTQAYFHYHHPASNMHTCML